MFPNVLEHVCTYLFEFLKFEILKLVNSAIDKIGQFVTLAFYLKGYALCRRPPLSGRGLRGGGYVVLAHLPC